jgi:threonine/homoserine/homoserine lactone efflux protein
VVLVVYGALTVRTQPTAAVTEMAMRPAEAPGHVWSGFWVGLALILLNPAAIVTWVVIVGSFMFGATQLQGVSASVGVVVGALAWFTFVAYLADHGKKVLGAKSIWITRVVGMLLIGYGIFSLGRAAHYLFTKVL